MEQRKEKKGLNITYEVRNGILNHTGDVLPQTLEGQIVKYADRIAYINHDIDDSIRANIITQGDLPKDCLEALGGSHSERINNMITDILINSFDKDLISMSEEIQFFTDKLRSFMFNRVYLSGKAKQQEGKAKYIIEQLYNYYLENFDKVPSRHRDHYNMKDSTKEDIVCDYIAGMTDRYVINLFSELFIPLPWDKY